jgi:Sec-independent protein translocase protein TatA
MMDIMGSWGIPIALLVAIALAGCNRSDVKDTRSKIRETGQEIKKDLQDTGREMHKELKEMDREAQRTLNQARRDIRDAVRGEHGTKEPKKRESPEEK